jgi:hypothetical protein
LVVLQRWEWPGDRLFGSPTGSRDVTIDGHQQTLVSSDDKDRGWR